MVLEIRPTLVFVHPNLVVVKGDVLRPETFGDYLEGIDAVISALGVKSMGPTTLYSEGNRNLLQAMEKKGVSRVFFISASALDISPLLPFYARICREIHPAQKYCGTCMPTCASWNPW